MIDRYIEKLRAEKDTGNAYCDLDREREITYMEASRLRFSKLLELIASVPGKLRLLDVGPTPFTLLVKEAFPQHEVWALDRTDLLRERFTRQGVHFKSCNLDDVEVPFDDEFFDLVIFTEVLEHVFAPPSDVLREFRRVLASPGKLILGVPNIARLGNRLRMVLGRSPLPNADHQMNKDWVHGHGHIHEFTRKEITGLCRANGFAVDQAWMMSPRPGQVRMGEGGGIASFVCDTACLFVPAFRYHILLECRKLPASVSERGGAKDASPVRHEVGAT